MVQRAQDIKRLAAFDSLDNRREFVLLLDSLTPMDRVAFAKFAVTHTPGIAGKKAEFNASKAIVQAARRDKRGRRSNEANTILTNTIYLDLLIACTQHEADGAFLAEMLELAVQHGVRFLPVILKQLDARRRLQAGGGSESDLSSRCTTGNDARNRPATCSTGRIP